MRLLQRFSKKKTYMAHLAVYCQFSITFYAGFYSKLAREQTVQLVQNFRPFFEIHPYPS